MALRLLTKNHAHPEIFLTIQKIILYISENWHRQQILISKVNWEVDSLEKKQEHKLNHLTNLIHQQKLMIDKLNKKIVSQQKLLDQLHLILLILPISVIIFKCINLIFT